MYPVPTNLVEASRVPLTVLLGGQRELRVGLTTLRAFDRSASVVVDVREIRWIRLRDLLPGDVRGVWYYGRPISRVDEITGLLPENQVTIFSHGGAVPDAAEPCDRCDRLVYKEGA